MGLLAVGNALVTVFGISLGSPLVMAFGYRSFCLSRLPGFQAQ